MQMSLVPSSLPGFSLVQLLPLTLCRIIHRYRLTADFSYFFKYIYFYIGVVTDALDPPTLNQTSNSSVWAPKEVKA